MLTWLIFLPKMGMWHVFSPGIVRFATGHHAFWQTHLCACHPLPPGLPRLHRSSQFTENSGKLPALPLSMRQVMRLSQVMGDPRFASKWFVMFGKPMVIRATPLYTPNFGPPNHHARNALRYASPRCWMRDQTTFACHTFAWQLCDKPYMPRSSYMGFSFLSSIPCHGNPSIVGMWLMTMPHINPSCRQTGANLWHPGISEVVHVPMGQSPRTLRTPK